MAKTLRNTTGSPVTIKDTGIVIPASTTYTVPPQDYPLWAASADIITVINSGTIIVNDGYDDLKPTWGLKHLQEESLSRDSALITTAQITATSNSTLTLTATDRLLYIFTGTTAGQIIQLTNATTLQIGHRYEIWNTSNKSLTVKDASGTIIFLLAVAQKSWFILQDNTSTGGTWLIEANFLGGTGGGNGSVNFGYTGTANSGRWLENIVNNPSNDTPFIIAGPKAIRAFSLSIAGTSTTTATIFVNTIAIDSISISADTKSTKLNLNYNLFDLDAVAAQITAGSCSRPVLSIWL